MPYELKKQKADVLSWLKLSMIFGSVNRRLRHLYDHHHNVEQLFYSLYYGEDKYALDEEIKAAKKITYDVTDEIYFKCKELGINMYCYESEEYPQRFKDLPNPPCVLFTLGSVDFLNADINYAEFVGSRKPTEYTKNIVPKLVEPLAKLGIGVVSGFADGVDKLANGSAREFGSPNVVFLAHSFDKEKDLDKLREVSEGGVVVSEFIPVIKKYNPNAFTMRNRLMTTLSDVVVICEEGEEGKGLDNVGYAEAAGKSVLAVPPADIFDKSYFGQRDLLRRGCPPVFSAADIVYYISKADNSRAVDLSILDAQDSYLYNPSQKKLDSNKNDALDDNDIEKPFKKPEVNIEEDDMAPLSLEIIRALKREGPLMANEIALKIKFSVNEVLGELTSLELDGIVRSIAGNRYKLL